LFSGFAKFGYFVWGLMPDLSPLYYYLRGLASQNHDGGLICSSARAAGTVIFPLCRLRSDSASLRGD
jgi:hypothetical protein